jgi:outer membrane protein OmpA-like peptidoglycan-associated protein
MYSSTLTRRLVNRSIGLTAVMACVAVTTVQAQESAAVQSNPSKQENIGVATGLAVGALTGGPIGAILGATAGAWLGDRYHRQASARTALAADLDKSESDRSRLAQNLTEVNGTLAQEQERGEQLDLMLSHTDEVETVVSFKTNRDSVESAALQPLKKLGELAAALPDAKVRVAGYADPRGSDAVNNALSKRRADAVAAILADAGVTADRLMVEAHGKSAATSDDGDVDGYALDRHVTVRIERTGGQAVAKNE